MTAMRLKRYPSPSGGIALGKMGVGATLLKQGKTARDYVQDGLIAMWDGIENAGWGTHDASATTWKDLVGGGISQFSQVPSWATDGLNVVPNSNTLTFSSQAALSALSSSAFAIEIVASMQTLTSARFTYIIDSTTSPNNISIFTHNSGALYILQKLGSLANIVAYEAVTPPASASCSTVYDAGLTGTNCIFYQDGAYTTSRRNTSQLSPSSLYALMSSNGPTGIYHHLRIYSRALTASEIAANYAIDKERFNLP